LGEAVNGDFTSLFRHKLDFSKIHSQTEIG